MSVQGQLKKRQTPDGIRSMHCSSGPATRTFSYADLSFLFILAHIFFSISKFALILCVAASIHYSDPRSIVSVKFVVHILVYFFMVGVFF
jgi:hypothetical protein